jgi:Tfp pilus assembly protein PilP
LDCTPVNLPVEFLYFDGTAKEGFNYLEWSTATERENDYFRVEKSTDGFIWYPVADVKGAGNSSQTLTYSIEDADVREDEIQYYRLKQFDFDGTMKQHDDIIAIINNYPKPYVVKSINSLGQEVKDDAKGIVIDIYSNGRRVKRVNP